MLSLFTSSRSRRRGIVVLVGLIFLAITSYISFDVYLRPQTAVLPFEDDLQSIPSAATDPTSADANITATPRILLVSAFFPLSKSKHTIDDYRAWIARFLTPISTEIYFFAPPGMEAMIRELRGGHPVTVNTTFDSPFSIPPLAGLEARYEEMHGWDREKERHSPELYAVWAAKAYFLDEAVKNLHADGSVYDYAFWNDAGSFRDDHDYTVWPSPNRVADVWTEGERLTGTQKEDLLFFPMWDAPHSTIQYWSEGMGPIDNEFSEGSFFGGSPNTISWWRNVYYAYHDYYLEQHVFVGKDQTLINSLFLLHPQRVITVWLRDGSAPAHRGLLPFVDEGYLGACGPSWFYYQFFLAAREERQRMRTRWEQQERWSWDWWRKRERCRLTQVLGMESVLKRTFGDSWIPPHATLGVPSN